MTLTNRLTLSPVFSGPIPPVPSNDPQSIQHDFSESALSADGNLLVFSSNQALDSTDIDSGYDVYVKDFTHNTLQRVPIALDAAHPDVAATNLSLSADGRYLAFTSISTKPHQADQIQLYQAWVKDIQTGLVTEVSTTATGEEADTGATAGNISADGHFVTFSSTAANLYPGQPSASSSETFIKNLDTGAVSLVSGDANGIAGNRSSYPASISADGRYVAFISYSSNLNAGNPFNKKAVFVKDMQTGLVTTVSLGANGQALQYTGDTVKISADGHFVLFETYSPLVSGDVNGTIDAYVKNLQTGAVQMVAPDVQGIKNYGQTHALDISANGQYVLFSGVNADLTGNQDSPVTQLYLRDFATGAISRVTSGTDGHIANAESLAGVLAGDGKSLVFSSGASNLGGPANSETLYRVSVGGLTTAVNSNFNDLGAGGKTFTGDIGDDSYVVSNADTRIVEAPGHGTDRVASYLPSYTLPDNVEQLELRGTLATHGIGNDLANVMRAGNGDNLLEGKGGNDVFYSGSGNNTFDGGTGLDTVMYNGDRASALIRHTADGSFTLTFDATGNSGHDTFINIERIRIFDVTVALDVDGTAGQAYRIYQAAFNRTPDQAGLGYWISRMDAGTSLNDVATGFVNSAEFHTLYGNNPGHADVVTHLYQNVLHRAPDAGGAAFWLDVLDGNRASVAQVLAQFSESPENKAALVGVTQNGIDFIPFA